MFLWTKGLTKRQPKTGRALIIAFFQLALVLDGVIALCELFWRGRPDIAASAIAAAYGTTLLFAVVYCFYARLAPGEISRDTTNSRLPPTGRNALRFMGLFCAVLLIARAIASFNEINLVETALPMFGVFATITALGLLSRLFASLVTLDQDQGIRSSQL